MSGRQRNVRLFLRHHAATQQRVVERRENANIESRCCPTSRSLESRKVQKKRRFSCTLRAPRGYIGMFRVFSLIRVADAGSRGGVNGTSTGQAGATDGQAPTNPLDWRVAWRVLLS